MNPNEGCRLTHDEITGEYTFKWWGRAGHTYFIQCSDDLIHWSYVPVIESGAAAVTEYGFSSTAGRFFLRLRHTDAATGGNPDTADFDGDHVPNMAELDQHTDPLLKADTDGDQMPDDWEKLFSFDPASAADGLLDTDTDGLTNRAEWLASSDPRNADTDGDGFQDGYEVQKGADPALASSSPLTLVQAQRTALTAAVQAYLAARAANADAETRKTLWDAIQQLAQSLLAQLGEMSLNTQSVEVLGEIQATTEGIQNDTQPAHSTPSTPIVEWRWMNSSYEQTRWTAWEARWIWDGASWYADGLEESWEGTEGGHGSWSQSDENSGDNSSLSQARERTPSFSGASGGWQETDAISFSAEGSWEEGMGWTTGDEGPEGDGDYPGQIAYVTKVEYTPESFSKQYREARIRRSGDGDPNTPLQASFVRTGPSGPEPVLLEIPEGAGVSAAMEFDANPAAGESAAAGNAAAMSAGAGVTAVRGWMDSVTFSGAGFIELHSDDNTVTYSGPHWYDHDLDGNASPSTTGDRSCPAAYKKSSTPKLDASFLIPLAGEGEAVRAMAVITQRGGGNLILPLTTLSRVSTGATFVMPATAATAAFENAVRCYNAGAADGDPITPLKIEWKVKIGDAPLATFAKTRHTLYLTYDDPKKTNKGTTDIREETLFYIGCRYAPAAASGQQAVVDAVFNHFKTLNVQRVKKSTATPDGNAMTYWKGLNPPADTKGLLSSGDGKCGAWARFFVDVLRAQGIDSDLRTITPPAHGPAQQAALIADIKAAFGVSQTGDMVEQALYVKNWDLSAGPFFATDEIGIPGQGNNNPHSAFKDHSLVKFGSQYYDPSYGAGPFADMQTWESASIATYGGKIQHYKLAPPGAPEIWRPSTYIGIAQNNPDPY